MILGGDCHSGQCLAPTAGHIANHSTLEGEIGIPTGSAAFALTPPNFFYE